MNEPTVDEVRNDLRYAIFHCNLFHCNFMSTGFEIENRDEECKQAKLQAQNFVAFGANSKLFSMEEAKE